MVKVNVNVGTSRTRCDYALEEKKAQAALDNGADAIMDLSTGGEPVSNTEKDALVDTTVGTVWSTRRCAGRETPPMLMPTCFSGSSGSIVNRAWIF